MVKIIQFLLWTSNKRGLEKQHPALEDVNKGWNISFAGFVLAYAAPASLFPRRPGMYFLRRGSTVWFHTHPNSSKHS